MKAGGKLSRTVRVSVGIPYTPPDPDRNGRTGLGDAIRSLRQGDLKTAVRVLQILTDR